MDNEHKRHRPTTETLPSVDSANRARNRTVMLTPELTDHVRQAVGEGIDPQSFFDSGEFEDDSNSGWDETYQRQLGSGQGRQSSSGSLQEDDDAEWARPIEPAMISEPQHSNGMSPNNYHEASSRSARDADERPAQQGAPRVLRQQGEARAAAQRGTSVPQPEYAGTLPQEVIWRNSTGLVGFLVTFDHDPLGSYIELRTGRLIVSSEPEASGNCLVINDSSVSQMHAIMRVSGSNTIQILDQLSENGTRIRRPGADEEELLSGDKSTISHGDTVLFGDRKFHVCLLYLEDS